MSTSMDLSWMTDKLDSTPIIQAIPPAYGDVTCLNTNQTILGNVGHALLHEMASDVLVFLETSLAVYEANGDYAYGAFVSNWCSVLDRASRDLCKTTDNVEALQCGKWICHECCWNESAKAAISSGEPTDIECPGGIRMYAVPIYCGEEIIGAVNIGYGNPPTDPQRLQTIANDFDKDIERLKEAALSFKPRPPFIIDLAKKRLHTMSKLIGEIVFHKKIEKALQISETKLNAILSSISDAVFLTDDAGTLTFTCPNASTIFQYSEEEIYRMGRIQALLGEDFYSEEDLIRDNELQNIELERPDKSNNLHSLYVNVKKVAIDGSTRLIVCRDVTKRKDLEKQLFQVEKLASIGTLASGLAHDFNNVNHILIGNTELLLRTEDLSESVRQRVEKIRRVATRATNIGEGLLQFARPRKPRKTMSDIADLARDALLIIQDQMEHEGVTLEIHEQGQCVLHCDRSQITQLFFNLISNAWHALTEADVKKIAINIKRSLDAIVVEISDTGSGIRKEDMDDLFTPFYSTKGVNAPRDSRLCHVKGTGLGLSVCASIVKNHGGTITMASEVGRGTTCTVSFPRNSVSARKKTRPAGKRKPPSSPKTLRGVRVLIVDDELEVCNISREALTLAGSSVTTATSGAEGLLRLKEARYDVVILDIAMPSMNGMRFLEELPGLALQHPPRVIVMTGLLESQEESIFERGAYMVLCKPVTPQGLELAVLQALPDMPHKDS